MSPERDHDEIEDLLAAFVLGATDPQEEALVREHLEGCSTCTSTVQRLRRALGAVPELEERLLDDVFRQPRVAQDSHRHRVREGTVAVVHHCQGVQVCSR